MGTLRFDAEEVSRLLASLQSAISEYKSSADVLDTSFDQFVTNEQYKGFSADAAKLYMKEVEMGMFQDILELHQLLFDMHTHMQDSFARGVDASPKARIDINVIEDIRGDFRQTSVDFAENATQIETKASSIAAKFGHLADFVVPDSTDTKESYKKVIDKGGFMDQCIDAFVYFDESETGYEKTKNYEKQVSDLVDRIRRIDLAFNGFQIFKPSFNIYDMFKILCSDVKTATDKYLKYLAGMHTYLLGVPKPCSTCVNDPVNICNGNYINEHVDIKLGGKHKLQIKRFYNAISKKIGPFGLGWTHNYNVKITETEGTDNIAIIYGDGTEGSFVKTGDYYLEEHGAPGVMEKLPGKGGYLIRQVSGSYEKFDAEGFLIITGDSCGDNTEFIYEEQDGNRRLKAVKSKSGNELTFSYFAEGENAGLISHITDQAGRTVSYAYEFKKLTQITEADGAIRQFTYDFNGKIRDVINPKGITSLTNEYDDNGRTRIQSFPDNTQIIYEYDDENMTVTTTEQNGNKVIYTHDELERHTRTDYFDGHETYTYNLRNQKISSTDKRGNTTRFSYDRQGHITRIIDPRGNATSITYLADGKPMAVKGPKGEEYKYSYDFFGKLSRFTNPLGESLKFFYNKGNISKLVDENGAETLFEYDNNCNVKTVTDPDGVVTVYEYDSLNRVTATITADGARTTYEYDEADRIVRTRDALGNTREYTYDRGGKVLSVKEADGTVRSCQRNVMGKVTEVTDQQGRKTLISYNAGGKQEQVTLPNGGIVRYEYDPLMRLIRQTDPEGRTITLSYDPNGNVIAERIGDREAVTLEYDALNRVISSTDALGNTRSYDYDENGKLICLTDPLGNKFTREYDLLGRVTKETDPLGNSTVYTYRAGGNIQTVTDAAGCVRRFEYTRGGKLKEVYFCDKLEQRLTYDVAGRISRRSFPDGYEISYTYDALSRFSKVQASDGRTVSYEYDAMGRVVRLSDVGSTTLYTYTPSGRLKSVVDALGNETAYTYDAMDNLAGIHRAEGLISKEERDGELFPTVGRDGHVTLFSYNLAGQLTGKTDALGQEEIFSYDQYGRLIEKTDRDQYKTSYRYDPNGQISAIDYADGRSVEFAYDALGRLDSFTDWLGRTTVERDALGRVTSVLDYNSNKVSYTYGPLSQRTSITYPDGNRVDYIYDDRLRLKELVSGEEKTSYLYDEFDRLIEKKLPNADRQVMTYLQGGRLGTLEMYDPQGMLDKYVYGYDEQGNRNTIDRLRRDLQDISGRYSYEYDPEKRLTKALFNDNLLRSYEYDAFGNRTRLMEGDTETTYSYDVLDRLVERKQQNSGLDRVMSYEYDRRGNQIKEFVDGLLNKAFDFDATNMLTRVTDAAGGSADYGYNGLGNRVSVVSPEERIDYLIDLTKRYHNMLERSVDGEAERYIYDSNVVSMSRAGESYFYLQDELGSGMYLTGTDGLTAEAYAYDEFGRSLDPYFGKRKNKDYTKNGNILQPFAFTGYQQDEMSERYYAQARYYDPETGRFVSKDKDMFMDFEDTDSLNLYGYCQNNPLEYIDPTGNVVEEIPWYIQKFARGVEAHLFLQAYIKKVELNAKTEFTIYGEEHKEEGNGTEKVTGRADILIPNNGVAEIYEIKPSTYDENNKKFDGDNPLEVLEKLPAIALNAVAREQLGSYVRWWDSDYNEKRRELAGCESATKGVSFDDRFNDICFESVLCPGEYIHYYVGTGKNQGLIFYEYTDEPVGEKKPAPDVAVKTIEARYKDYIGELAEEVYVTASVYILLGMLIYAAWELAAVASEAVAIGEGIYKGVVYVGSLIFGLFATKETKECEQEGGG